MWSPKLPLTIIYMLQATEYNVPAYLKWLMRTTDFGSVMRRKQLVKTKAARLLLMALKIGILLQIVVGVFIAYEYWHNSHDVLGVVVGAALSLSAPGVMAYLIVLPLLAGRWLIIKPSYFLQTLFSSSAFEKHPGLKIAVAGSYGKTTMKEMLLTVLGEGKKVAATPANKNVAISHAKFAKSLQGDEEVLIIEYGEGAPGDVAKFAKKTHPDIGIITGLAPAHLDKYKTIQRAGDDIFSLGKYVPQQNIYVNGDSEDARPFIKDKFKVFSSKGLGEWKVTDVKNSDEGLKFTLQNKKETIKIKSKLLGRHQIGPLALVAVLANDLGLSVKQVEAGINKIDPFEHRMQPYHLNGALVIDDTYNGNIEGMKAGLELLKELPAKRKIYITPGLVDQGDKEHEIHVELGRAILKASPDIVVLMMNSVMENIIEGLTGYKGRLIIEDDPLNFYTNLDKFVAVGDFVLMQNDWPDNYN